jgi:hypothetical protein
MTSGYCFTISYKGGTGLIIKGELIKDTLKIPTKGEFFYIRTGTNGPFLKIISVVPKY